MPHRSMPRAEAFPAARRRHWLPLFGTAAVVACASYQTPDPDIVRPALGAPALDKLPGPLLVFDSYQNALLAACQKIVTKPHATAGRRDIQGFNERWRAGVEYCAWIYYTPDEKYVLSKLTDQTSRSLGISDKTCVLPPRVEDQRFPPESIQYVYAIHNHLYDDLVSQQDMTFIVSMGVEHGFEIETKDGKAQLSIVAFFSSDAAAPRCDGFYQYIPSRSRIFKWTRAGGWVCEQTHLVDWNADFSKAELTESRGSCDGEMRP
jgi:hypothetical protein